MTDTELAKYNSIGLVSGQTASDVLTAVVSDVIELVRGYIKGCPRNGIDSTASTLPSVLHSPALDIIIVELMKRVGGAVTDVSDVRIAAYNSAMAFMDKVSDCRFGIPKPTTEATESFLMIGVDTGMTSSCRLQQARRLSMEQHRTNILKAAGCLPDRHTGGNSHPPQWTIAFQHGSSLYPRLG